MTTVSQYDIIIITTVGLIIMLLLLLISLFLAFFKPWRFLSRPPNSPLYKVDDIERPLLKEDGDRLPNHINDPVGVFTEGHFSSPGAHGLTHKQRLPPQTTQGGNLVLNTSDQSEDILIGQTLRRPLLPVHIAEEHKHIIEDNDPIYKHVKHTESIAKDFPDKGSCLSLEVTTGLASGLCCSVWSTDSSKLPLTLGRVPPSDLLLKDSEVSGKHAVINWNPNKGKWELVDMGSLNGTLLNSVAINNPNSGSRKKGELKELADGDVITLGTTSRIKHNPELLSQTRAMQLIPPQNLQRQIQVTSCTESDIPFGVGIASDPMSMRRGGKNLPMEDVCYYQLPLHGADQFGVFGICDGHGGALAAKSVSRILPETIATILSDSSRRGEVLFQQDARDILSDAFFQTESCLNNFYEGCTATLLLVWVDGDEGFFAQCANVGDSACVLSVDGNQLNMSEDHRITSDSERKRINEIGEPLKDGAKRLCGLNLGRMMGDKYLKEQDGRFSSKPYVSEVVRIGQASEGFALLASDGLWDVISVTKSVQLILQARERYSTDDEDSAQKIANYLLNEARVLRTKDNTSIIYVNFDTALSCLCKYDA